jgi:hypothetical protein
MWECFNLAVIELILTRILSNIWCLHAIASQNVNQLIAQGGNILPDFHNVVLSDTVFILTALSLNSDISFHQELHHSVVARLGFVNGFFL